MTGLDGKGALITGTAGGQGAAAAALLASAGADLVSDGGWSAVLPGLPPMDRTAP
jgi:NAD(P)-dependent dehydrogenase (short-subunit alcohol dehydrogenase family)